MFYSFASSTSSLSNILNNVPTPSSKFNLRISIKIACDLTILLPVSASASGLDRFVKSSSSQAAEQSQISKSFSPLDPAFLRALCTFPSFPKKKIVLARAPASSFCGVEEMGEYSFLSSSVLLLFRAESLWGFLKLCPPSSLH
ncbi:hypothetical protein TRVL_05689 [Trypanosoma vivax]|nr:hypothetical protein TRVL_05689 [Trypanosoma vivax]